MCMRRESPHSAHPKQAVGNPTRIPESIAGGNYNTLSSLESLTQITRKYLPESV
jgi:hypothetical protein